MQYFSLDKKAVLKKLNTSAQGLDSSEVKKRQEKYGLNEIKKQKSISLWRIFLSQFKSFIVYILIFALAVSLFLQEFIDAGVSLAIIIIDAIYGFVQEYKAEKSIQALRKLARPKAVVIRNGQKKKVKSSELVPGDIVELKTGDSVPADMYLLQAVNMRTNESTLTGESLPVSKKTGVFNSASGLGEQKNMLFASTTVVAGHGLAVVTKTGMKTEIGKIAGIIQSGKDNKTPLQKRLSHFGVVLGVLIIFLSIVIFTVGCFTGQDKIEMLFIALSLAVAAIPEGLPAVVTVSLALGVQRMVKKNVLIRKLAAVEALGSTTVICSDKTGTLTRNEMTVRKIYFNSQEIKVSGIGYEPKGDFSLDGQAFSKEKMRYLLETGFLCNNAYSIDGEYVGDPTEIALLVLAEKAGIKVKAERLQEKSFTSEDKYMATWHEVDQKERMSLKGAPEVVLEKCSYVLTGRGREKLTKEKKQNILQANEAFAGGALRVLALAYSSTGKEKDLVFLGLTGMIDPPRKEVKKSIKLCRRAGMRVVMITGDHKTTAQAIGRKIGITGKALTGKEIDQLSGQEFAEKFQEVDIYARVSPEHKVKILQAYQKQGNIVAMTGDGVNDAPAIKKSDIGVAVNTSTDVAKQAADMILTDQHFKSIVAAVKEGRHIFTNIKKFIKYLLSCNLSEILTIFIAVIAGLGSPLAAVQILWMNLVTDGLPALALSSEPEEKDIMKKPPRDPKESILNKVTVFE